MQNEVVPTVNPTAVPEPEEPVNEFAAEHPQEEPNLRELPRTFGNLARLPALAFIRLYQMTFARALPPNTCRFYPTCSHYGYQAIYKYGLFKAASWQPGVSCAATHSTPVDMTRFSESL